VCLPWELVSGRGVFLFKRSAALETVAKFELTSGPRCKLKVSGTVTVTRETGPRGRDTHLHSTLTHSIALTQDVQQIGPRTDAATTRTIRLLKILYYEERNSTTRTLPLSGHGDQLLANKGQYLNRHTATHWSRRSVDYTHRRGFLIFFDIIHVLRYNDILY
jgi:hypothetical protein